jgi:[acyl-carrier-protein] S-malonyltransferase
MIADGATEFIEVGPGTALQGMVKRISPETDAHSAC